MDRVAKFANMYCRWIEDCLTEDEKWEELAFFELGIDLGVRQKELLSIKWSQVEFPYVNDIAILKATFAGQYYSPKEISRSTIKILNKLPTDRALVFSKDVSQMTESIRESIGDSQFSGHMMRKFGAILKTSCLDDNNCT